ncbi:alkene reductase [Vibrio splendidus]|uniref:Alkene reductase n=1 Tax=Vibrio lentus TaxID=136468 RepID=A0A2J6VXH6_9VIBR|nr:alkene reductase [Vibrio lentus]OBT22431.1 alkene reductase [Vibrio tasmaniensis]PHN86001.1 alkene reductase [Vibrio splendidus]MCC4781590.1 alkene reductase [Vibrio lentus]MCC4818261.1 alkene reductase [Vibrio lentus]MCC4838871.1 alkene reductase [Vibrio lentus]
MKHDALFSPIKMSDKTLKNRIVMPPLTRSRSTQPNDIPNDLMADYYGQRSSAGFMVTEGTQIEPRGQGYAWTPGIYSAEQVEGWKKITKSVHDKGGIIYAQLWHVGRVSHTSLQPNGEAPVAPSAILADAVKVFIETAPGEGDLADPSMPRELSTAEVKALVEMYAQAARNAVEAGFDGVELHCANGYLVNQFISAHTNHRTDEYGGNLENRLRFLKEITQAVADVVGKDKVGVRFAPLFETTDEVRVYLGMVEEDTHETYVEAIKLIDEIGVGYLSLAEADWDGAPDLPDSFYQAVRANFSGLVMYAGKYTAEKATSMIAKGYGDIFGFGRPFIANPDLPDRIKNGWSLNEVDPNTMYGGTNIGYSDYSFYNAE